MNLAQMATDKDGLPGGLDVNTWPGALVAIIGTLALAAVIVAVFYFIFRD